MISEISGIDSSYEIPDELWNQIFPLLVHKPKRKKKNKAYSLRMDDIKAMNAYLLHSTYWMSVENTTTKKSWWCISSTVHDRFQEWRQDGVFKQMWIGGLKIYDEKIGINWKWQSMDGAITKAPLGEKVQQDQIPQTEEVNQVPNVAFL